MLNYKRVISWFFFVTYLPKVQVKYIHILHNVHTHLNIHVSYKITYTYITVSQAELTRQPSSGEQPLKQPEVFHYVACWCQYQTSKETMNKYVISYDVITIFNLGILNINNNSRPILLCCRIDGMINRLQKNC